MRRAFKTACFSKGRKDEVMEDEVMEVMEDDSGHGASRQHSPLVPPWWAEEPGAAELRHAANYKRPD